MLKSAMKLPKFLFLLPIILLFLFFTLNSSVWAQESIPSSSLEKFQKELKKCANDGTVSMECWIGGPDQISDKSDASTGVMPAIANSLTTMIIGAISADDQTQSYRPGGAIGGITTLITALYANPPASSVEYFADLGRNLGIVKPAYAQAGFGFEGLKPILPLWKTFRNIAYLFFAIVFVVIGFAIMFRVKINPQTVISIQNAIPRVIIALILVTFSYAIAGLLIDLMYLLIGIGVAFLAPLEGLNVAQEQKTFMKLTFSHGFGMIMGGGVTSIWTDLLPGLIETAANTGGAFTVIFTILSVIIGGVGSVILTIVFAFIALWVMLKLFISLLKCYISIILSVIFGPLQIMIGVLPGSQAGFGAWFRNLLANIMVFPAVALFMLLGWILIDAVPGVSETAIWTPPLLSGSSQLAVGLIAFGMLLMVYKVPDIVKDALKIKPFPYGTAIGEAVGAPFKFLYQVVVTLGTIKEKLGGLLLPPGVPPP